MVEIQTHSPTTSPADQNQQSSILISQSKTSRWIVPVIIMLIIFILGILTGYLFGMASSVKKMPTIPPETKGCTMEAKVCPDGSSVGRTGPHCEFTPCPSPDGTRNWKIFQSIYGYTIRYPSNMTISGTGYIPDQGKAEDSFGVRIFENGTDALKKPHINITVIPDSKLSLNEEADRNYILNMNHKGIPAAPVEKIHSGSFLGKQSIEYSFRAKGFVSYSEEYAGYEGIYKIIWVENSGKFYMIVLTQNPEVEQILSTFQFETSTSNSIDSSSPSVAYIDFNSNIRMMYPQNVDAYGVIEKDKFNIAGDSIPFCMPDITIACFDFTKNLGKYRATNFQRAGIAVNIIPTDASEQTCTSYNSYKKDSMSILLKGVQEINTIAFYRATRGGTGLGSRFAQRIYRSFHKGKCYEVNLQIDFSDDSNVGQGLSMKEFTDTESNSVFDILAKSLVTFMFIN